MTEIKAPKNESKATELPILFKKHKKLISEYYHFTPFKEPIMFFIRRTGKVEFKEKVTTGRYIFTHSDGEERYIIIDRNQLSFQIGDRIVKGYICHEDHPFPLPENPIMTTEQFNIIIEKTLHDKKEWETKLVKAKTKMVWAIVGGICAIIGMVILFKILVPTPTPPTIEQQLAEVIKQNATVITNATGITVYT